MHLLLLCLMKSLRESGLVGGRLIRMEGKVLGITERGGHPHVLYGNKQVLRAFPLRLKSDLAQVISRKNLLKDSYKQSGKATVLCL